MGNLAGRDWTKMQRKFKVDFYRTSLTEGPDLEKALHEISQIDEAGSRRNIEVGDDWVRLSRGEFTDGGFVGDLLRIRMVEGGFRADLGGGLAAIELGPDEGLAEAAAFFFHFKTGTLVYQRNARGPSAGHFCTYLKQAARLDEPVELERVVKPDAMARVRAMPRLRKVWVKSVLGDVMAGMGEVGPGVREAMASAGLVNAGEVEIQLKAGKAKGAALDLKSVEEWLGAWLAVKRTIGDEHATVQKMVVAGVDEAGQGQEFDILEDRLEMAIEVEMGTDPEAYYAERMAGVLRSWDLQKGNIKAYLDAGG